MESLALLAGFGRVGLFAFGGGPAMVPLMQQEIVGAGWLSGEEFLDALALGNSLPGPLSIKMAVLVGWKVDGVLGVLASLLGVAGPAVVLMLGLSAVYLRFREHPALAGALRAVRPVVIAMLAWTVITLLPGGIKDYSGAIIALAALAALLLEVHPVLVIGTAMGVGALVLR
jgi:chromate transporter